MPLDSNGNASLVPSYFVQDGDDVLPVQHNPPLEDIAAMLSMALVRDGRAPMSGNLNMGVNKITNLAEPTNPNDAARLADLTGQTSDIIYDEEDVTFTTASPLVITGITEDMRAVEIEVEATGASPNPGTVNLFAEPGDGSTFATNGQSPIALWTNGGTGERRGFCTVKNFDDPALGIYIESYPHSTGGSTSLVATIIPPSVFASRPITEIRLRPVPSSGTTSVTLSKCRVRGIRS